MPDVLVSDETLQLARTRVREHITRDYLRRGPKCAVGLGEEHPSLPGVNADALLAVNEALEEIVMAGHLEPVGRNQQRYRPTLAYAWGILDAAGRSPTSLVRAWLDAPTQDQIDPARNERVTRVHAYRLARHIRDRQPAKAAHAVPFALYAVTGDHTAALGSAGVKLRGVDLRAALALLLELGVDEPRDPDDTLTVIASVLAGTALTVSPGRHR